MTTDILCGQTKQHEQRGIRNELNLVFCTNYFSSRFGDPLRSRGGRRALLCSLCVPRSSLVCRRYFSLVFSDPTNFIILFYYFIKYKVRV